MADIFDQVQYEPPKSGGDIFDQVDASAPVSSPGIPVNPDFTGHTYTGGKTPEEARQEFMNKEQVKPGLPVWDTVKTVAAEPFKLAGEAIAAPINAAAKAGKGYMGLASAIKAGINGGSLDDALQSGVDTIGNRNPVQSPLGASKTGEFLGEHAIRPGIQAASDFT